MLTQSPARCRSKCSDTSWQDGAVALKQITAPLILLRRDIPIRGQGRYRREALIVSLAARVQIHRPVRQEPKVPIGIRASDDTWPKHLIAAALVTTATRVY